MKIFASAVALLATAAFAASASAASFSPANGNFTGTGTTSLTKGTLTIPCTANFTGHTAGGIGFIDTATFSGGGGLCGLIHKTGTWTATAATANGTGGGTASITGVAVTASLFGTCGPSTVAISLNDTGLITFNNQTLSPDCAINGSVQTSPQLHIVP
ncbi:activator of alkane oxidation [Caulobacter sp. LjRoot300]|uniref:activator of alkane oxidation n=1 Tax=Caulobacter sp. LjRoot300 TaxID=3342321 RepID=UPI003ECE37A6